MCCKDASPSPFSTSSAAQTYALAWYLPTATPCRTRLHWSSAGCSASIDSGVVAAVYDLARGPLDNTASVNESHEFDNRRE